MPAIKSHSTAVDAGAWDGGKATKNAKAGRDAAYYGNLEEQKQEYLTADTHR